MYLDKKFPLPLTLLLMAALWLGGCQPTPPPIERDYKLSMSYDGVWRTYKVHLPQGYAKDVPMPLVIYLHGGGGNSKDIYVDRLDQYADEYGFILAAPNGTGEPPNKLLTWNSGTWSGGACCGYAAANNVDDVGFISALIAELRTDFSVDEKRIYVTGISNGAMMTYRLACELADQLAAVAAVAPPAIPQGCAPARPISVMHIHGTADTCTPYKGGPGGGCLANTPPIFVAAPAQTMVDFWKTHNQTASAAATGYQSSVTTCERYANPAGIEVEFCTITGGLHAWPTGERLSSTGAVVTDISFAQIWDFFARQKLP